MSESAVSGYVMRHRGWWVLRYRDRVGVGGRTQTVQRAKRLAPIDAEHKTKASVRELAKQELEPITRSSLAPLSVTKLALREVKTHQVQSWLEAIARGHEISKTTLKHIKNFLSGVFRHAAQQGYFDGANPVKLAEVPAFARNGAETSAYSFEEIAIMLKILSEPSATAVATAAFTRLRLGELRGLTWESFEPATDEDSLGWLNVTRSVPALALTQQDGLFVQMFPLGAEPR